MFATARLLVAASRHDVAVAVRCAVASSNIIERFDIMSPMLRLEISLCCRYTEAQQSL
jgi:hypothetical protein